MITFTIIEASVQVLPILPSTHYHKFSEMKYQFRIFLSQAKPILLIKPNKLQTMMPRLPGYSLSLHQPSPNDGRDSRLRSLMMFLLPAFLA